MANPIIKIKTSTTQLPPAYNESTGRGLTFGELGARIGTNLNGLYIGGTGPNAIRIGSEVSDDNSLSGTSPFLIPTQRSVRSYVNSAISGINNSGAFTLSRNATSALGVGGGAITPVLFQGTEFSIGSLNLTYAANGVFTNTTGSTLRLNVFYQILWSQTTFTTNANTIQRSNWIQTSTGNIYGFSTGLVNPIGNTVDPDLDCIISASCIITLANNESFQVYAKNHSSSATTIITGNSLIPNQGGTRIQIMNI